jgi:hypothetical protein
MQLFTPEQVSFIILCMPLHEANVIAVKQLQNASYKDFIVAAARFEDQVEELRKMGAHSVCNIYANMGAAYADYERNDCMSHPPFAEHFIGDRKNNSE